MNRSTGPSARGDRGRRRLWLDGVDGGRRQGRAMVGEGWISRGFGWRRDKLPRNMGGGGGRIRWIDGTGLGFHLFI